MAAAAAAAVTLLRLPLARLASHLRSVPSHPLPPPRLRVYASRRLLSSLGHGPAAAVADVVAATDAEEELVDATEENHDGTATEAVGEAPPSFVLPRLPRPKLSVKERKELASYAHGLGKKLKSQQVGKAGVTPNLVSAFNDNLESNELLNYLVVASRFLVWPRKWFSDGQHAATTRDGQVELKWELAEGVSKKSSDLKIHGNCPMELPDVILQLEESTGSVAVDQIGRSVILYRPSTSKMKKKQEVAKHTRRFVKSEETLEERPRNSASKRYIKSGSTFRAQPNRRPMTSKGSS
ncbi:hypothetical protein ACP70R_021015 [Stipagrostis hirtigluma subsp. patula]